MKKLEETLSGIAPPDISLRAKTLARLNSLTKPPGSLGRLEELAERYVRITGNEHPEIKNRVIFTMAADHGVTEEGVSAFPKEVTAQMVYNFLQGGAGINVLAEHTGARVVVADVGVAEDLSPRPGLVARKVGRGTKNMAMGPAMTAEEAVQSVENGIDIFLEEFVKGMDIAGIGEMGIGNTTAASAIAAVVTGKPAEEVTGTGTGIDEKTLPHKISVIKKAIEINSPVPDDGLDVLSKVGGFEIGAMAGVFLAGASKKIPVVIDGFISGAAALIACKIAPAAKDYMIAGHVSAERGHGVILDYLGLEPVLNLGMRLGEGTGAALAIFFVDAGVKILTRMATFESAGVSGGEK